MDSITTRRGGRALALLLATLLAAAFLAVPTPAGAVEGDGDSDGTSGGPSSTVAVDFTASDADGPCVDPFLALSNTVSNTEDAFVLRITVAAPLCAPLDAAAVIYDMPGDGVAWPQTLAERLEFTLDEAGVLEVTFTKGCGASQFDVITGASPATIAPSGPHHGPLLFPLDTGTTLQHTGDDCTDAAGPSTVDVDFTPSGADGPCLDPFFALSNTVSNTAEAFVVRVIVGAPLCYPLDAAAAIYDMPGDGVAWPQRLAERLDFTLDEPGVLEVTFTKGCGASQFDVLTGETPETISPLGPWHGPLLFPFDLNTTLQYEGPDCEEVAPGTDTTTTTTVPEPPVDDDVDEGVDGEVLSESDVLGVTTVPAAAEPQVLGATQVAPEELAFTGPGQASTLAGLVGGALLLAGLGLLVLRARVVGGATD
jgi:hypothetical protein